jgi:hypothetical protein
MFSRIICGATVDWPMLVTVDAGGAAAEIVPVPELRFSAGGGGDGLSATAGLADAV